MKIFIKQWTIGKIVLALALATLILVHAFSKWGWIPQESVNLILVNFYNNWYLWAIGLWAILFFVFRWGGENSWFCPPNAHHLDHGKPWMKVEESIQLDKWALQQTTLIIIAITLLIISLMVTNIFHIMHNASLSP